MPANKTIASAMKKKKQEYGKSYLTEFTSKESQEISAFI
jgi:hypothetical protein